jgi:hypothetical protein
MADATLDRETAREARDRFPGASVPARACHPSRCAPGCRIDHAARYDTWVQRMALWAFHYGPALLGAAEADAGRAA